MILNKQKKVRLATRPLREFLRKTQRELKIANSEITIAFVSDAEIAQWNEAYRKKKGPTDVLSFPATSGASHKSLVEKSPARERAKTKENGSSYESPSKNHGAKAPEILGDIAIAPETAKRYAK